MGRNNIRRPQIACPNCKKFQEVEIRGFLQGEISVVCNFCEAGYRLREIQDCFTGESLFLKNDKLFV